MPRSATEAAAVSVALVDCSRLEATSLQDVLSAAERQRYRNISHAQRAGQYLASRWLLRQHLATRLGIAPAAVALRNAPNRPPSLCASGWRIGLSHSGRLCLCIISPRAPVGCDVEQQRPRRNTRAIAASYFHAAEAASVAARDDAGALADFYSLWSLKEATVKARRRGLADGLQTPAFSLEPRLSCIQAPDRRPWTFAAACHRLGNQRYSLALAIAAAVEPPAVCQYRPEAPAAAPIACPVHWQFTRTTASDEADSNIPHRP